jgi:galactose mutarotase-like enzyme
MTNIKEEELGGFKAITIKSEKISLTTIPELGGKIISIINRGTDFDFVWRNEYVKLKKFFYDSNFSISDSSGVSECFPTIAPCKYMDFPWKGIDIPDHGEIWPLSFKTIIKGDKVTQETHGVRFPYIFTRVICVDVNVIKLSYKVDNLSQFKFNFIWSIHPIFKLFEGTDLIIKGYPNVTVDFSTNKELVLRDKKYKWPVIETEDGRKIDFSRISVDETYAVKFVLLNLSIGEVTLKYSNKNEKIDIIFNKDNIKYCGLWVNNMGWPEKILHKYRHIAIEPCSGVTDSLGRCIYRNGFSTIKGNDRITWDLIFKIQ